ncbi:MAG TPA: aliphatic sulfonates ABC transporter substrate-binding protein [Leptospiraceae bacterium]|nr:aliphatic sulfonate ABC transporter substrate-binding protein [Spirochaetaceae bacterium]HBS04091.1 aliphatic sulfonates ABC transporter substrate-binding protein [Leptospiraceae bacterium]
MHRIPDDRADTGLDEPNTSAATAALLAISEEDHYTSGVPYMLKNVFKGILIGFTLIGLGALLPACGEKSEKIRIGYSDWPGWVAWEIAIEKGMFKEKGVDVEFVWFDNYVESLQAMDAGKLDGNCQTWNDTIFSLATTGAPMKAVLINDNSAGNDGVVANGITSLKDLKGKTVAAEEGTVSHFVLLTALKKAGLSQDDVEFKNMFVPDASNAVTLGNVSAAALWQPSLFNAMQEKGMNLLFTSKEMPGLIPDMLVFHEKVTSERKEDIQKIVEVWFEVMEFIENNPDEAYAIMAKKVNQTPENYKTFVNGTRFFTLEDNLNAYTKGSDDSSLYGSGATIAKFYTEVPALNITEAPAFEAAIDDSFVKAIE